MLLTEGRKKNFNYVDLSDYKTDIVWFIKMLHEFNFLVHILESRIFWTIGICKWQLYWWPSTPITSSAVAAANNGRNRDWTIHRGTGEELCILKSVRTAVWLITIKPLLSSEVAQMDRVPNWLPDNRIVCIVDSDTPKLLYWTVPCEHRLFC